MQTRALIFLPLVWMALASHVEASEPSAPKTKVPPWDARGVGLLPWQGVACLDVNNDATRILLGTIASPGDPNVLLLDGAGRLLRQQHAGQRWINQVALTAGGGRPPATFTLPPGRGRAKPAPFPPTAAAVAAPRNPPPPRRYCPRVFPHPHPPPPP